MTMILLVKFKIPKSVIKKTIVIMKKFKKLKLDVFFFLISKGFLISKPYFFFKYSSEYKLISLFFFLIGAFIFFSVVCCFF